MKPVYNNMSAAEVSKRQKSYAIDCAWYFHELAKDHGLLGTAPRPKFGNMTIAEIDQWIAAITSQLGIRQFGK